MTAKPKKTRNKSGRPKRAVIDRLFASVEDDLFSLAEEETRAESHWNRPLKQRVSLRMDREVVDWFKSKGPGYQTRINRILRRVMQEGKNRERG
ncbi:MAG TPA: BrnA antitoxin family protein [Candidatus Solibacter sp.]|nr:BrnA antitoxin family protein [Candidatus Solibacter sp.]